MTADPIKIGFLNQIFGEFGPQAQILVAEGQEEGIIDEIEGCEVCYIQQDKDYISKYAAGLIKQLAGREDLKGNSLEVAFL